MSLECVRGKEVEVEGQEWECGVSVQCERVKEEPGREGGGQTECGASVQCVRVKEEPESAQDRDSSEACPTEEEEDRECGVSAAAAQAGLYAGHEVKGELVLGPERLQPPDSAFVSSFAYKNVKNITGQSSNGKVCIRSPGASCRDQLRLRDCSVRLERLPVDKHEHANNAILLTSLNKRLNKAFAASKAYYCDTAEQYQERESFESAYFGALALAREVLARCGAPCADAAFRSVSGSCVHQGHQVKPRDGVVVGDPPCMKVCGAQLRLGACSSSERLPRGQEQHADSTSVESPTNHEVKASGPPEPCAASEPYTCDTCGEQFARKRSLIPHIQLHSSDLGHAKVLTLDKPSVQIKKQPSQRSYLQVPNKLSAKLWGQAGDGMGEKINSYKCEICFKVFSQKCSLAVHKRIHTGGKPFKCDICNKQFAVKSYLRSHKQMHTGPKPHKCETCMKQFLHKKYLVKHEQIHTGEKPYKCDICMRQFANKGYLSQHKKTHTGQKPYKCEICMKRFRHKWYLVLHERIHTGEKPFKCDICMQRFAVKNNLVIHERNHTGEKPYKCEICMKLFSQKGMLVEHERIHTKEKPFKCEICMKWFTQKSALLKHNRIHLGKKPHKYESMKQFLEKTNLVQHKQIHVVEEPYKVKPRDGVVVGYPTCMKVCLDQLRLGACSVGVERLPRGQGQHADSSLQPRDSADAPTVVLKNANQIVKQTSATKVRVQSPEEGPRSGASCGDHIRLRVCSVRLERLPPDKENRAHSTILSTNLKSHNIKSEGCTARPVNKPYSCDTCGEQFARKQSLIPHIQLHCSDLDHAKILTQHKSNVLIKKQSSQSSSLLLPRQRSTKLLDQAGVDTGKKPKCYECEFCKKQFALKNTLVSHERIHTGEKPYNCQICFKQFSHRGNLVKHERTHTGEKPYKCEICFKPFSQKYYLVEHERIHSGVKPYKCEICFKQFSRKTNLNKHEQMHTGEKPYKCEICLKHFCRKYYLVEHERIHTGENPYKCEICFKQFSAKGKFVKHERIHTGEKPYKCEICFCWHYDNLAVCGNAGQVSMI